MTRTVTMISPTDSGRAMSLAEFDGAEGTEGHRYELSRGVIIVTDVPNPEHLDALDNLDLQISTYRSKNPGIIHRKGGGSDCKLLIEGTQSERHPDLAIYKTPAPGRDSTIWSTWVPEIVVEVVSAESAHRDYVEKPEDYLLFGVLEYWIIDPIARKVTIHSRFRGQWKKRELIEGTYETALLPGFSLDISAVLNP